MSSTLIRSHTQLTQNIIKEKFIELYEKKPLERITVSEICSECGISRTAFYQHFDDKYAVLDAICGEILTHVQELNVNMHAIKMKDTDKSIPLWVETATYISEKKNYFRPLICYPSDSNFIHKWKGIMQNTLHKRLLADGYKNTDDLELVVYSMASAIIGIYEYWFQNQPELTPTQIAQIGSRLLWSSFHDFVET